MHACHKIFQIALDFILSLNIVLLTFFKVPWLCFFLSLSWVHMSQMLCISIYWHDLEAKVTTTMLLKLMCTASRLLDRNLKEEGRS